MTAADVRLAGGLILLISIAFGVLTLAGVRQRRPVVTAGLRAAVQLAIVAAALRGVFAAPITVVAMIAVMFGVATWTSARRIRMHRNAFRSVVAA
jgi:putative ABC transport system permease protein